MKETKFKQTEVGMIPSDWEVACLGDLGSFKNGISKPAEKFGHGFPFVNLMDIFEKTSIKGNEEFGLIESVSSEQQMYSLRRGDVLFVRSSVKPEGVGLTTVVKKDLSKTVFSGFILRFRELGERLNTDYKEFVFYSDYFRRNLIASSTVSANTNINQPALKKLIIAFPKSIEEQQRIANALSDVDTLIANLEKLIAKKKNIKQGAMQQLLTGKKRLPGFGSDERQEECHSERSAKREESSGYKMTELGMIPSDWEVKKLNELCECNRSSTLSLPKEFVYVDLESVYQGKLLKRQIVKACEAPSRAQRFFEKGDILYQTVRPYQRNNLKVDFDAKNYIASTGYAVLHSKESLLNCDYLYQYIHTDRFVDVVMDNCSGTSYPAINPKTLMTFEIIVPSSIEEQFAIANVLSDMDTEISVLETKLAKYRTLKTGMMQQLLTGKIRLV